ncbi:MAG TPA: hypothetical protein VIV12_05385 [Streptosporangiaceae bacterium]
MPEFHDDLEDWLHGQVRPLEPPPGAFELIRKRARRRKLRQAALSVAGAAAVVAVAATVPQVLVSQLSAGRSATGAARGHGHASPGSSAAPGVTQPSSLATGGTPVRTSPPPPPPVPTPFSPSSVTFVGTGTGWVIGQAGTPGQCGPPDPDICTSIARTDDGGKTWSGVPAPVTGPPDGSHGVSQVRFLDLRNGWAFGPELWATHDGGHTWVKIGTRGTRVTALETRGKRAFAVWAQCSGPGPDFAANCTNFVLYSASAGSDRWAPVPGAWPGLGLVGTASSADLVLTGAAGYLLPPDGILYSGPVSGAGTWQPTAGAAAPQPVGCNPGAAQPDGQPSQAMIAATGTQPYLALLCADTPAGTTQAKTLYYSTDGGKTWQQGGAVPTAGAAASLSGSMTGGLVLATSQGLETAAGVNGPWRQVGGSLPAGGFSYVGMTTASQGVAVPAEVDLHAVWLTYDGGLTWHKSLVR